jgi:riboflavin kinase
LLSSVVLRGRAVSGAGVGARFTQLDWVQRQFQQKLGLLAWPGTFNVHVNGADQELWRRVRAEPGIEIEPEEPGACVGRCYPVVINERLQAAIVLPEVPGYPEDRIEIIAPERVRTSLDLRDGDPVVLRVLLTGSGNG